MVQTTRSPGKVSLRNASVREAHGHPEDPVSPFDSLDQFHASIKHDISRQDQPISCLSVRSALWRGPNVSIDFVNWLVPPDKMTVA